MAKQAPKSPIVPIIVGFSVLALGVVGYQVFQLSLRSGVGSVNIPATTSGNETGNVFKDMALNHPKAQMERRRQQKQLQQSYNAAPYPHNVQKGNLEAKTRLTIFTDIACGTCRQEVERVLQKVPLTKTQVVFKHSPVNPSDIKSGLFEQMARRANILPAYHAAIYGQSGDVDDKFMMSTLNRLGVSYQNQQLQLKDEPGSITRDLDKDLKQGDRAGIDGLPTFFLNRYRMSPSVLPVDMIGDYINKLDAGEPIYAVNSGRSSLTGSN